MDRTKKVRKGEKNQQQNEGCEKRNIKAAQTECLRSVQENGMKGYLRFKNKTTDANENFTAELR